MNSQTVIAEVEMKDGRLMVINRSPDGKYDVIVDGVTKQPDHDADGIIRYLANIIQNAQGMN